MVKPFFKEESLPPSLPKSSIHKKPDSPIVIGKRIYDFNELRSLEECGNFDYVYPVEAEMRQRGREDNYDIQVVICWGELYGDTKYPPSEKVLFSLARNAIEQHFIGNNYPKRRSSFNQVIRLRVAPDTIKPYTGPF